MEELIAGLALTGKVIVIDGGNCFNSYAIAHIIRQKNLDHRSALSNIWVARAFTCQQMVALLERTPADGSPKIVLNFLSTFKDDGIDLAERGILFRRCLDALRCLNKTAPVYVNSHIPDENQVDGQAWFATLENAAGIVLLLKDRSLPLPSERMF